MKNLILVICMIFLVVIMTNCGAVSDRTITFATVSLEANFPHSKSTQKLVTEACAGLKQGVEESIREGAIIDDPGKRNIPPIFWAVANGCREGVGLLIQAGAEVNAAMQDDATPVWFAAGEADLEILKLLLNAGGDPNHISRGSSPLLEAALAGRWDNVRVLVGHGADVNWATKSGATAAGYAVARGEFSQVLFLLKSGYHTNLAELAGISKSRVLPKESSQIQFKDQVLTKLRELGYN